MKNSLVNKRAGAASVIVGAVMAAGALAGCHPVTGDRASGQAARPTLATMGSASSTPAADVAGSASPGASTAPKHGHSHQAGSSPSASARSSASGTTAMPSATGSGSQSAAGGWTAPATSAPTAPTAPTAPASSSAPAQSGSPGGTVCVQTTNAKCDFSADPSITGVSSVPYVNQNEWAATAGYKQSLYAANSSSWYVVANANTHFGGVLTFPNTGWDMSGTVDSRSSIMSSYSTTIPVNSQTAGWAAYDLWFNNWADEVMIQTDITANSDYNCTAKASATFDGEPWHLCIFGSERVWKPGTDDQHLQNRASGTLNIEPFLTWMEQNGYLPANSSWTAGSYGFEICDTGGANETFQLNSFSWSA